MPFRLSRCVGICAEKPQQASKWYSVKLGLRGSADAGAVQLDGGILQFFIDPGKRSSPVLELLAEDLDHARAEARVMGFREAAWNGLDKLNLLIDPFGVKWNVFQWIGDLDDYEDNLDGCLVSPKVGILCEDPEASAQFYANMLGEPATHSPEAWIIDSGPVRLRLEKGLPLGPVFYLTSGTPLTRLGASERASTVTDANGVTWKAQPATTISQAVTEQE